MPRRVGAQRADWTAGAPAATELQREEGSSEKLEFKMPAAARAKMKEPLAACSIFGVASSSGGGSGSTDEAGSSGGGGGEGRGAIIKAKSSNAQPLMQQEERTV